jgi:hypothetical protein
VKYTVSEYYGARCRELSFTWLELHLDVRAERRRCPGFGFYWNTGRKHVIRDEDIAEGFYARRYGPGGYVDLNAPMGEPNRAAVHGLGWQVTLGLPSFRDLVQLEPAPDGTGRAREVTRLRAFHLDGICRYRYHPDETGRPVRDPRPAPGHWGWLTAERRRL